jgi:hypothetical protein
MADPADPEPRASPSQSSKSGEQRRIRRRRATAWQEIRRAVGSMLQEGLLLVCALAIMWVVNWVAQHILSSVEPASAKLSHGALLVSDGMAFFTIVVPRAIRFLIEVLGLVIRLGVVAAAGVYQIKQAYKTGKGTP